MKTAVMKDEEEYLLPSYEKFPFALERGEGCYVWDEAGNRYLDLYGGHAVALLGHSPPEVVAAVSEQAGRLLFYSNLAYSKIRAQAAKSLVELCGRKGSQVFFCNSGAEANENALKLARSSTGRARIVATEGSFHGRTAGALSVTGLDKYRKGIAGLPTEVTHIPFGNISAAEAAITADVAGVILEPIQSMSGITMPPAGYLQGLEKLCRERGALLIFDEVQTGLGRLGAPSAAQAFGISPHIMTFAKGLGSGVPCGAILVDSETAKKVKPGDLGSTFGGGPLACAAVNATLSEAQRLQIWKNSSAMEAELRSNFVIQSLLEIRGKGLLLGLVFDRPTKPIRQALLENKILVGGSDDPNVMRLLPPLTVTSQEINTFKVTLAGIMASQNNALVA